MSGIVGIVNLDGAPVDRSLLQALTGKLVLSGPDAEAIWTHDHVGFGHALLCDTDESQHERQPSTLDGHVWITADARVDGRADLIRELLAAARTDRRAAESLRAATDDTLLLHAYHAWGDHCVEHLLGDFAFAIWDAPRGRLFCARDQLGVKPFFFAMVGPSLIFATELDCVRSHPSVTDDLNDLAIADFLLFGQYQELESTAFAAIEKLPPAHTLTWSDARPQIKRYWQLSVPAETRFRRADDYVQRFNELLQAAVGDRLRTDRVGVLMSGGVDSPIVAATAKHELTQRHRGFDLRAHTIIFETLIPDDEKRYAGIVAKALDIPIRYHPRDSYPLFGAVDEPGWATPEPPSNPWPKFELDLMRAIAAHCRVALTGSDGDALCQLWLASHFTGLVQSSQKRRALADAAWFAVAQRSLPPIGLRARLQRRRALKQPGPPFPPWLDGELVARLDLRARWRQLGTPQRPVGRPVRADAVELLTGPALSALFDSYNPPWTKVSVSGRHPLLDVRIINYALSLPPIPWAVDKTILRSTAKKILPMPIYQRPKAPLAADPAWASLRLCGRPSLGERAPSLLEKWVTPGAMPALHELGTSELLWPRLWAVSLDHWLAARGFTN